MLQLRKVNSTTQLVLRQGLRSKVAGLSPTVSQYIFAADDIVSGHVMVNGEWETGELAAIIRKLQLFAAVRRAARVVSAGSCRFFRGAPAGLCTAARPAAWSWKRHTLFSFCEGLNSARHSARPPCPPPQSHKLRPKDVWFVDVGANVGVYTLFVAAYGFNVLAFEPLHVNVMALRHSLCANPLLMQRITLLTQVRGCHC